MSNPAAASARPGPDEYFAYYEGYVSLVPEGHVVETLERQAGETLALLRSLPEERGGHRYGPGKWSVKQLVGHVIDAERVFSFRALAIARGERRPLPDMDQDAYMAGADFDARTLADLAEEFEAVRRSTLQLFRRLPHDAWQRRGIASDNEVSVRALAYITAGHEAHHVRILRERYLTEGKG